MARPRHAHNRRLLAAARLPRLPTPLDRPGGDVRRQRDGSRRAPVPGVAAHALDARAGALLPDRARTAADADARRRRGRRRLRPPPDGARNRNAPGARRRRTAGERGDATPEHRRGIRVRDGRGRLFQRRCRRDALASAASAPRGDLRAGRCARLDLLRARRGSRAAACRPAHRLRRPLRRLRDRHGLVRGHGRRVVGAAADAPAPRRRSVPGSARSSRGSVSSRARR
jgi:hypothetical protein